MDLKRMAPLIGFVAVSWLAAGAPAGHAQGVQPPSLLKFFGTPSIPLNGTTTLTFRLENFNPTAGLGLIGFTDPLPPGLVVATPNGLTGSCSGTVTATPGSSTVSLANASLAPSFDFALSQCTFTVNVRGASAGTKDNTTGAVTSTAGPGGTASATLIVVAPPAIAKAFGAASLPVNGTTTLSFTLTNPNAGTALTGVGFTDPLPAGLVVAAPNGLTGSCAGTITATAGSSSITLAGGTLAAGGSCVFSVDVRGIAVGGQTNTTGAVTSTEGGPGNSASAVLAVDAPPIPTLTSWAFALLAMLLTAIAVGALRARRG